jgi:hypothetical protein
MPDAQSSADEAALPQINVATAIAHTNEPTRPRLIMNPTHSSIMDTNPLCGGVCRFSSPAEADHSIDVGMRDACESNSYQGGA